MTVSAMATGLMAVGLVVTGMRNVNAGSRVGLLKRRRDDAGELGDQEEGDFGPSGRERQSHVRSALHRAKSRCKPAEVGRPMVPVRSAAAPLPSPAFLV